MKLKRLLAKIGFLCLRLSGPGAYFDLDNDFAPIYARCRPFTLTSIERMYALYKAVEYTVNSKIPGDFVECGVWRGGSAMMIALTLQKMNDTGRKIYLYDTFSGMNAPTEVDISFNEKKAQGMESAFAVPLKEVQSHLAVTGYPLENILYVKGNVEETIPARIPDAISLLRLDTDWYESTYHELHYLYPRISPRGVIIVDDYGFWKGARKAVDQYLAENHLPLLLHRIDNTGRIGLKV